MIRTLISALIIAPLATGAWGFAPASGRAFLQRDAVVTGNFAPTSAWSPTHLRSTEEDQAEIAALEERLRELKGGANPAESATAEIAPIETAAEVEPASIEPDEMEGETEDSIMFSERWKETKDEYIAKKEEDTIGGIGKIALALGFVVLLGIFSQVPVGEESLQRYQDVKGNPSRIDLGDLNPGSS